MIFTPLRQIAPSNCGERLAQGVALEAGADFVLDARRGLEQVEAFLSERVENDDARHDAMSESACELNYCRSSRTRS